MKRHLFWIVELFIWLLILFSVSGVIMFAKYTYKKNFNTYQIFLPDVDGLIVGSPVKFMGIQIGYVNQVDIVGEDVYVKFVITEKGVRIPPAARVTVEFSGLGGSKSLEVYPPSPQGNPSGKFIVIQSPKRIHDSLGLLNDMFDKAIGLTYDVSHFMDEIDIIKKEDENKSNDSETTKRLLNFSNNWLDNAQTNVDKVTNKLNNKKEHKNEQ